MSPPSTLASLQQAGGTEKILEPKLMDDVEWEEAEEDQEPTVMSPAERVLNKTAGSRNSRKKSAPTSSRTADGTSGKTEKIDTRETQSSSHLDLSKMDKDKIRELGFPVRLLFEDFISR